MINLIFLNMYIIDGYLKEWDNILLKTIQKLYDFILRRIEA